MCTCFLKRCSYGLINLDQIRKISLRKNGYALRGERAVCRRLLVRGKRVSAIAALSTEGLVALELTDGSVDGDAFLTLSEEA